MNHWMRPGFSLTRHWTVPSSTGLTTAMFFAVLALLATRKRETSKHGGAISLFDKEFVKPGTFTKDFSRWLHDAFDLRQRSDYVRDFKVTREEAEATHERAVSFVEGVKTTLAELSKNQDV